jgi:exopolysaccharide biosynthesis polyprenyl glycosylphosphotransferase
MIKRKGRRLRNLLLAGDLAFTALAFGAAFKGRFLLFEAPRGIPDAGPYFGLLALFLMAVPLAAAALGLYKPLGTYSRIEEGFKIALAALLAFVAVAAALQFYREFSFSRLFLGLLLAALAGALAGWRFAFRGLLRSLHRRGRFCDRILIIGAGSLGRLLADHLLAHREIGLSIVGFLDDDPAKAGTAHQGLRVLGGTGDLQTVLEAYEVDAACVAIPMGRREVVERLVETLHAAYTGVYFVPDVVDLMTLRAGIEDLHGLPVIHLSASPLYGWGAAVKRAMDLTLGLIGTAAFLPLWAVIAVLIRREDGGPVFYLQERMGLDGRRFRMIKFRSMRVDAEAGGPTMASRDDRRKTRIGRFLRAWSLDETPQFLNVLKGEMSLVGPRPERPEFVAEFTGRMPEYVLRHRVRSGITGWAQVNGLRGKTSIRRRLEYDLYYIQNWSLWFDLRILLLTLLVGFRNRNAY